MLFSEIIRSVFSSTDYRLYPDNILDIDIKGISCDSRKVFRGYIFAAINGYNDNGSKYISEAVDHGAAAILTENNNDIVYSESSGIYVIHVKNVRRSLADIALKLYFNDGIPLDIFGITGTNGKTSVSLFISHILNTCNIKCGVIGTLGRACNGVTANTSRTTPDIVTLCEILTDFSRHGVEVTAMEVSSHALELERVHGIKMKAGVFTNLTEDHLDFHRTMDSYGKAKEKLFYQCEHAVINIDDDFGKKLFDTVPCKAVSYSMLDKNADLFADNVCCSPDGTEFTLFAYDNEYNVKAPTHGVFNVMNMLAAIGTCHIYGVAFDNICSALSTLPPVTGRFECISKQDGICVILDYAHTPDGIKNALETASNFTKGRLISVFGCGGDRDAQKRSIMGRIACELSDYAIITTDNPRSENEIAIANEVASSIEYKHCSYNIIIDREKALQHALESAKSGDTVMIMGKGHEKYQQFGNIRYPFSDKDTVLRIQQQKSNK